MWISISTEAQFCTKTFLHFAVDSLGKNTRKRDERLEAGKIKEQAKFQIAEEFGGLELLDAQYETQNFSRHSHEGYTVGVIERGAQSFYRTGWQSYCAARQHYFGQRR